MKKTYDAYTRCGKEELSFAFHMYAEEDSKIIQAAIKLVDAMKDFSDVGWQIIVKHGDRRVLNFSI